MPAEEILEDLFFIERGYLNGNHFVVRSDAPVLIDTGYVSDFDETERLITGLGVDLSHVSLIVNTHTHCDHIGGNRIIQERSGCDIALHRIGRHFIETGDDWSTWWRYYKQEADFFRSTRTLEDGDTLFIGPHRFRVIHTPGHASDGIVLYHPEAKILISSDTLWESDMAVMTVRVEGSAALFQMQDSLGKIEALDVRKVYPGHGRPFHDIGKALAGSRDRLSSYLSDPRNIGRDLLKKIIVYTLLMKKRFPEEKLFPYLMDTVWFRETVDLYFKGQYRSRYDEIIGVLIQKDIIKLKNGLLYTTVRP
jgi:glyoxylase-like metal-dependent hydrolase (beta-lactamase superfamily II)